MESAVTVTHHWRGHPHFDAILQSRTPELAPAIVSGWLLSVEAIGNYKISANSRKDQRCSEGVLVEIVLKVGNNPQNFWDFNIFLFGF